MNPTDSEILATATFCLAILHTFMTSHFETWAAKFEEGSIAENLLHFTGEVEVVFGLWAAVLIVGMIVLEGPTRAFAYVDGLSFTESLFVFAIMAIAATSPVIAFARGLIFRLSKLVPLDDERAVFIMSLIAGPLLGSLITEPAAMTLTALLLRDRYFHSDRSSRFKYWTMATLFVNVSVGGALTHFAAPPILMVAGKWGWDLAHMLSYFGWKAAIAVFLNAILCTWILRKELRASSPSRPAPTADIPIPRGLIVAHLAFLGAVVWTAHHPVIFMGLFLFFIGLTSITREYQEELKLKEGLLVAFFLSGLVVLGGLQDWWLAPLIQSMSTTPLFVGTTALTALTDNAALTYLGAQVPGATDAFKYALVAGAISGGGLTVIANAPNPAGYSILHDRFGVNGISAWRLFLAAVIPTLIAMSCLWFLP